MTFGIISLRSGIPVSVLLQEDDAVIQTYIHLLEEEAKASEKK